MPHLSADRDFSDAALHMSPEWTEWMKERIRRVAKEKQIRMIFDLQEKELVDHLPRPLDFRPDRGVGAWIVASQAPAVELVARPGWMHDDPRMNSRVHPNYKTRYRVTNWPSYDRALVQRGDITMWVSEDAIDAWKPRPSRRRGGQKRYSDTAIETTLTLRLFFNLPLRQTEGFLRSLFDLMGLSLEVPDHTTLSRRGQHLNVRLRRPANNKPMHLIVDSTGLSMVGEGEWAAAKHGKKGKRAWKKLHLGVDRSGVIVAQVLTDSNVDDANTGVDLIGQVDGTLMSVTGDAAYDTSAIYDAALERGAKVVVPPTRKAVVSGRRQRAAARDRTIRKVKKLGRREWKKVSGYHRQGTVENAFFRYKSIIGDRLRARHPKSQRVEVVVACNALNKMFDLGRPVSKAIAS
jgi:IS5 family transposase